MSTISSATRAGRCASGTPPTNLGFRLVRESRSLLSQLASGLGKAIGGARS
jgi:hypothetical protein